MGNWGVKVFGGTKHGVVGCDIYQTGQGGIHLEGGDRKTLTPAEHYADNNHVHHTAPLGSGLSARDYRLWCREPCHA